MAIISPINLNKWLPNTPILSSEAKQEFMNLYNLVNGQLDAANFKNGSITGVKLADNSVKDAKIESITASKITGKLTAEQLPMNILTTDGGTLTGTILVNLPASTAILKNMDSEEIILYEGGTGTNKVRIYVGGVDIMRITVNDVVMWKLAADGTEIPKQFKVPVV